MENKYVFYKGLYKDYVIVFLDKGKRKSMKMDKHLLKYLKNKDINYVLVDNDFKVKIVRRKVNNYYKYLIKEYLYMFMEC